MAHRIGVVASVDLLVVLGAGASVVLAVRGVHDDEVGQCRRVRARDPRRAVYQLTIPGELIVTVVYCNLSDAGIQFGFGRRIRQGEGGVQGGKYSSRRYHQGDAVEQDGGRFGTVYGDEQSDGRASGRAGRRFVVPVERCRVFYGRLESTVVTVYLMRFVGTTRSATVWIPRTSAQ